MNKEKLIQKLVELDFIKKGTFVVKSGETTDTYFNVKQLFGAPKLFSEVVDRMIPLVDPEATCIVGTGVGGVPLATMIAQRLEKPLVIVRDIHKNHGIKQMVEGYIPGPEDKVVIVDDVFTSGTSISNTEKHIGALNAPVIQKLVTLHRSLGKTDQQIDSLFVLEDFQ